MQAFSPQIHQALEARLAVAEKEIKEAEREKLEKEESAQKYLAYEESVMEKVVQESKILKQEAEENSKVVIPLRFEFLFHVQYW